MKILAFSLSLIGISLLGSPLQYPKDVALLEKVELYRPEKIALGRYEKRQELTENESKQLLFILGYAEPVKSNTFHADYYIIFTLKDKSEQKLLINKNKVKNIDGEHVYQIRPLSLLLEF